jgi:hypothetical protein
MATHPEALAQIARLLGDESLRLAGLEKMQTAIERGFERLSQGILAEVAASDDVSDRESAYDFVEHRLEFLGPLLNAGQRSRLRDDIRGKIDAW